jgi:hypothetical protein
VGAAVEQAFQILPLPGVAQDVSLVEPDERRRGAYSEPRRQANEHLEVDTRVVVRLQPSVQRPVRRQELAGEGIRLLLERLVAPSLDFFHAVDDGRVTETVVPELVGEGEPLPLDGLRAVEEDEWLRATHQVRARDAIAETEDGHGYLLGLFGNAKEIVDGLLEAEPELLAGDARRGDRLANVLARHDLRSSRGFEREEVVDERLEGDERLGRLALTALVSKERNRVDLSAEKPIGRDAEELRDRDELAHGQSALPRLNPAQRRRVDADCVGKPALRHAALAAESFDPLTDLLLREVLGRFVESRSCHCDNHIVTTMIKV